MVRKRSRTAPSRRKTYDSDDEDLESDLDVDSASPTASPEPKRYGLRQRTKKTIFFEEDYDDYEPQPKPANSDSSDDDDEYVVEEDLKMVNHKSRKSRLKITPRRKSLQLSETVTVSVSAIQPIVGEGDVDATSLDDGLIDFEDMIRADVVVNKKLDEEVFVAGKCSKEMPFKKYLASAEKGRRGRKPKQRPPAAENPSSSLQPTTVDDDANFEVQIDPLHFVQCETAEPPAKTNGLRRHHKKSQNGSNSDIELAPSILANIEKFVPPKLDSDIELAPSILANIEKFVPPKLDEKEKEVVLSNEYLLGNSFDMTADQFLERQAQAQVAPPEDEEQQQANAPLIDFNDSDSDDDVVIIEKKPEIIVLDDD